MYEIIRDRKKLHQYILNDPKAGLYLLGDLDDFFWPHTTWHTWIKGSEIDSLILQYQDQSLPVFLIFKNPKATQMEKLITHLFDKFPTDKKAYFHCSPCYLEMLQSNLKNLNFEGHFFRYILSDQKELIPSSDKVMTAKAEMASELKQFYDKHYPQNF